ncbi:hypothetical protein JRO89_XS12G0137700 [Xanthoceras sorbifolium]|uniref:Pentatricopeptide repeat-containing protein n=1 Tax=Xanthoceras sorbifolium TaxID=99658 RepID=A0ABQ8HCK6_9ROSI|nr:hypothetical protein JRO89_XS12G0137700 [Xanthoceras sorbifolium]
MKLVRLGTILPGIKSQLGLRNALGVSSSSYSTTTTATAERYQIRRKWSGSMHRLYRMISPVGDPKVSIVPVLDQWVQEGGAVDKEQLHVMIKELRSYKRFTHALQISMWMSDKRYIPLTATDVAVRLDLISKVQGIEQAENYFNNIPKRLRTLHTYGALLNCYAYTRNVEKAEATMNKIREFGLAKRPLVYNCLLGLYHRTGNYEKLESLMHEMEENGTGWDRYTYGIRLAAYAAVADAEGVDKTVTRMESDTDVDLDWTSFAAAATAYTKAGLLDKALAMLKKSEGLINGKRSNIAYAYLMTQYATCGEKDEVLRLWQVFKEKMKIHNNGYISVMTSVLKFDDLECAERIFEEWESKTLSYDIRIPNFLIGAYGRKGLPEKAETLIGRIISKGEKPDEKTWYYVATGYLLINQPQKAVEKLKQALMVCHEKWRPQNTVVAACLEYFKREGDMEAAGNFINLLGDKNIISVDVQDRLLNNFLRRESNLDALSMLNADACVGNGEALSELEPEAVGGGNPI